MKAAFLIRCSTKYQDLDRQVSDLTRLAKSMGYEYDLDNLVYGEKITGKDDVTKRNRASIDRLLKGAKEQKFDVVLVSEVSRMSRDPASGRIYVRLLINMEIPVYFRDIDIWTIDPNTKKKVPNAEITIGGAFDAAWKYLKSMKTQIASARRNYLDKGAIALGTVKFGYRWNGGKDKHTKTKWVADEVESLIVPEIFTEYLKEGSTLKSTALAISASFGDKTTYKFTVASIHHILTYDSYATGVKPINLADPDREEVEVFDVEIPKLIPMELYEAVREKLSNNRVKGEPYPSQATHLLSKLIKCPCCGYSLTPRAKGSDSTPDGRGANGAYRIINGKKAMSWVCMSGVNNSTKCPNRMSIANEKLEPIIWELVKNELIAFADVNNEDRLAKIEDLEGQISLQNSNIVNFQKELDKLAKRLSTAFQVATSAAQMAEDDEDMKAMAMEEFNKTAKAIRKDKTTYEGSITAAKKEIERLTILRDYYSSPTLPKDIIEKAEANPTEQRNLVKQLITKIVPHKITTFRKQRREKGKESRKAYNATDIITVKNGAVLVEVHAINGVYYIFYNANGREAIRYAYYLSADVVYTGSEFATDYIKGLGEELFYIVSPYLYFNDERANDEDAVININEFVEIAKAQNQVLEYQYKPES